MAQSKVGVIAQDLVDKIKHQQCYVRNVIVDVFYLYIMKELRFKLLCSYKYEHNVNVFNQCS